MLAIKTKSTCSVPVKHGCWVWSMLAIKTKSTCSVPVKHGCAANAGHQNKEHLFSTCKAWMLGMANAGYQNKEHLFSTCKAWMLGMANAGYQNKELSNTCIAWKSWTQQSKQRAPVQYLYGVTYMGWNWLSKQWTLVQCLNGMNKIKLAIKTKNSQIPVWCEWAKPSNQNKEDLFST